MSGRACDWCKEPIPPTARRDAKTCSKSCRQAKHRFKVGDIFPGSGAVGRAWGIHMSQEYSSTPSRLREAQMRLTTRLSGTDTTPSCLADATDDPIQKGRS